MTPALFLTPELTRFAFSAILCNAKWLQPKSVDCQREP
jgi:hypothetical protein